MSRRLLRASLAAVLLLTPVARTSAKPPDLPLEVQTPIGPLSEQGPAPDPTDPDDPPVPQTAPARSVSDDVLRIKQWGGSGIEPKVIAIPVFDAGLPRNAAGLVMPAGCSEPLPLPVAAAVPPSPLRTREKRQLKTCLLIAVNPLLVFTPLNQEKCDRGGDQPTTVINGVVCPAPVASDVMSAPGCCVMTWLHGLYAAKKQEHTVETPSVPVPPLEKTEEPDDPDEMMCLPPPECSSEPVPAKRGSVAEPVGAVAGGVIGDVIGGGCLPDPQLESAIPPGVVGIPPPWVVAPVPEMLTVMPREVPSSPESSSCPYLNGQTKPCPVVTEDVDLENSVLANLNRLVAAEEMYQKGQQFQQAGNVKAARDCYDAVRHLCPGSNLDKMAEQASASLQTTAPKAQPKVVTAVVVVCGAERLHAEAVKKAEARAAALSEGCKREREIAQKLQTPVSMTFSDEPLGHAIEQLAAWNNLNIYVDRPALEEEGVNLERPVSLRVDQVSLKSALTQLLDQVKLTWIIKDEVLQITTPDGAQNKLKLRTYPVAKLLRGDLPGTGAPHERLIALITQNIQPRSWQGAGGSGTITYYAAAPGLIVNQTYGIHEEIADLLVALRRQQEAKAAAQSKLEMRIYHVADLVVSDNTAEDSATEAAILIKLIFSTVEPNTWSDMGGPGTIDYCPLTLSVVVNQTPEVHKTLAELLSALRLLNDAEPAALEMGARVQLAGLLRACRQAWEQGRLEKAADLALEALALDTTAHTLSFFGRVYLEHIEAALGVHHQTGSSVDGCKLHDSGEECKPAPTETCPAEPDPDLSLMWPLVVPPEPEYYFSGPPEMYQVPAPPSVKIPWCPPLPPVDFQVPLDLDRILEDAPLVIDNPLHLTVDEIQEPEPHESGVEIDLGPLPLPRLEKTRVPDGESTSKDVSSWTRILTAPSIWCFSVCDGFDCFDHRDEWATLSMLLSLGGTVFEGNDVDGNISVNVRLQE